MHIAPKIVLLLALFSLLTPAHADVKLPALIADGMVLEQRTPVRIYGTADRGEAVTVAFRGQKVATVAAQDGRWQVMLRATKAGGPFPLTVKGKNTITLQNVLVGEVWVCSGQSNMEFRMTGALNGKADSDASADDQLRMFTVERKIAPGGPVAETGGAWQSAAPGTTPGFSAVGYYFARALRAARHVPIGMIHASWGGTPIEAWTRKEVLIANGMPASAFAMPATPMDGPANPNAPSVLYNGMIAPLTPYTIKGALWYQGESNAGNALAYRHQLPDMIQNWRDDWGIPRFPFLIVQLASFMAIEPQPTDPDWAHLRESQYQATYALPNVGMAVIDDVGEEKDVHPKRKAPVGERLALLGRRIAYGEKIVAQSPAYKDMKIEGGAIRLTFDTLGSPLIARATDSDDKPVEGAVSGNLVGFAIAGADGKFVWADAKLASKDAVVVASPQVPHPVAVRFGWANYPVVNLYNRAGLPAVPFRTDVK